ncbi:uncharacterized protein G2W53_001628 [Senna tora]|uniref:Uncharacterized protein n=1 Tax=Senna tora TaxID=362788 RepID=A0A834XK21_9FABA|nr:uncharacterized protein G2W53_001628 [Senna tora]
MAKDKAHLFVNKILLKSMFEGVMRYILEHYFVVDSKS